MNRFQIQIGMLNPDGDFEPEAKEAALKKLNLLEDYGRSTDDDHGRPGGPGGGESPDASDPADIYEPPRS